MNTGRFLAGWGRILAGMPPMLSIEITRECPLRCPGCYAYEDQHLGAGRRARQGRSRPRRTASSRALVDRRR